MKIFNQAFRDQQKHSILLKHLQTDACIQLDGSQWSRLANQRLHQQRNPHEFYQQLDVLTTAQMNDRFSHHQTTHLAIEHWFSPAATAYEIVHPESARAPETMHHDSLCDLMSNLQKDRSCSGEEALKKVDQWWTTT